MAVLGAVLMMAATVGVVLAHHPANDGQRLSDQPPEVQALYLAVHGVNADARWVAEHNAALGPAPTAPGDPMAHPRYMEVHHVAYVRSGSLDLARRITESVIARGTVQAFMAGMDMGVLYGYVAPAPQPRAAPSSSSSSSSTSSGPSSPKSPSTSTVTGWSERSPDYHYEVGQSVSLTLPTAPGASSYTLTTAGTVPVGLEISSDMRKISGRPTATTAEAGVEFTYTALAADGTTIVEDHLDVDYVLTLTIHVRDADLMPFFTMEVDSETITMGDVLTDIGLPEAVGGNGDKTYVLTGLPTGFTSTTAGTTSGVISGGMAAKVGTYAITLTAKDEDGDQASLSFTITVEKDMIVTAPNIADMVFTVGDEVEVQLAAGSGGNGTLTYMIAPMEVHGLTLSGQRYLHGTAVEGVTMLVTYTVSDEDTTADTDTDTFTITVKAKPAD